MLKYIATILIAIFILTSGAFAQHKKASGEKTPMYKVKIAEPQTSSFYSDYQARKKNVLAKSSAGAQDLMFASYDWVYHSYMPTKLVMADITGDGVKDPIAIGEHNVPTRHEVIAYVDELGATSYPLLGSDNQGNIIRSGYDGHLILDEANNAVYPVVYDALTGVIYNYIWAIDLADISAPQKVTADGFPGLWPRAAYLGNGVFIALDDMDDGNFRIMKSTDSGVTFDSIGTVGGGDNSFWFDAANTGQPITADPLVETNGQKVSIFLGLPKVDDFVDIYTDIFGDESGATDPDSAHSMYHYYSTDAGATWQGEVIAVDGKKDQISNREQYPRIQYWDIGDYNVDKNGVTHLVHNGQYTVGVVDTEAIYTFPIYYWNDKDKKWIDIASPALENFFPTPDDDSYTSPGNFRGNSSPTVAISEDGNVVAAAWVTPEFSGEWGNSDLNVYPGDGGTNSAAVYYTDIVFAYSEDGGKTWSEPQALETTKNSCEIYPCFAPVIEVKGKEATINYMVYVDPIPGASLLSTPQNNESPNSKWVFNSKTITLGSVGVNEDNIITKYSLEQNYPNPFNPSTDIKFTLAKPGNVSLKIYDVLGREVATLVNGAMESGSHTINFNASNLSSGMYLYTINADNFSMTKKMMLMK